METPEAVAEKRAATILPRRDQQPKRPGPIHCERIRKPDNAAEINARRYRSDLERLAYFDPPAERFLPGRRWRMPASPTKSSKADVGSGMTM